jgi:uncharacterized protein
MIRREDDWDGGCARRDETWHGPSGRGDGAATGTVGRATTGTAGGGPAGPDRLGAPRASPAMRAMTTTAWLVPITAMRRTIGAQRHERRQGRLGLLKVADTVVPADAEVTADVVLTAVDGGLEVAGTVRSDWVGECRRCLRPVGGELSTEVRELYRPRAEGERDTDDEETYPLGVDHLDLAPLARDALLLSLPLAPLCREDCAGLCPSCGADLAEEDCGCARAAPDPRWAALDVLRDLGGADAGPAS